MKTILKSKQFVNIKDVKLMFCAGCEEDCDSFDCDYHRIFPHLPIADVKEVIHAHWEEQKTTSKNIWACSNCGKSGSRRTPYCPNCGADMNEEK